MLNIQVLVDDARCFEEVRKLRWPEGVSCPSCGSTSVIKRGFHSTQPHRQRYIVDPRNWTQKCPVLSYT
jgi:transposase-like protein